MVHSTVRFGAGVTGELGLDLANLGAKKAFLMTDPGLANSTAFRFALPRRLVDERKGPGVVRAAVGSVASAGVPYEVYASVRVEPTDASFWAAAEAAKKAGADAFVAGAEPRPPPLLLSEYLCAVGGGSTMDTAKAASLYTANPEAEFLDFVVGAQPVAFGN